MPCGAILSSGLRCDRGNGHLMYGIRHGFFGANDGGPHPDDGKYWDSVMTGVPLTDSYRCCRRLARVLYQMVVP